jgi:hypothetical protein
MGDDRASACVGGTERRVTGRTNLGAARRQPLAERGKRRGRNEQEDGVQLRVVGLNELDTLRRITTIMWRRSAGRIQRTTSVIALHVLACREPRSQSETDLRVDVEQAALAASLKVSDGLRARPVAVARELCVLDEGPLADERLETWPVGEVVGDAILLACSGRTRRVLPTEGLQ